MSNFLDWITKPISILMQNYMQLDITMKWTLRILILSVAIFIIAHSIAVLKSEKIVTEYRTKIEYRDTCIMENGKFEKQSFQKNESNTNIDKADNVHIGPVNN